MCSFEELASVGNFDQNYQILIRGNQSFMEEFASYPSLRRCLCLTPAAINMAIQDAAIILGFGKPELICSKTGNKSEGGPAVWSSASQILNGYILMKAGGSLYAKLAAKQLADYIIASYLKQLPQWPGSGEQSCIVSIYGQGGRYPVEGGQIVRWNATGNITCTDSAVGSQWTASIAGHPTINVMILDPARLNSLETQLNSMGIEHKSDSEVKTALDRRFLTTSLSAIKLF
jgi:hypothetical protein